MSSPIFPVPFPMISHPLKPKSLSFVKMIYKSPDLPVSLKFISFVNFCEH